jgi:hypothetical protein
MKKIKRWLVVGMVMVSVVALLAACGGSDEAASSAADDTGSGGEESTSDVLDTSYEGALDVTNQLALGTMEMEETANAVTPEQAATLLPLWQALQGGEITAQAEVNAVLAQIERAMTEEQLEAIAAMELTQESMAAWAEENGMSMPAFGGGAGDPASQEDRESIRATVEAGGEMPEGFGGGFGGGETSEEERANIRATVEAGGEMPFGGEAGGRAGGGGGTSGFLIRPLVELLTERARG